MGNETTTEDWRDITGYRFGWDVTQQSRYIVIKYAAKEEKPEGVQVILVNTDEDLDYIRRIAATPNAMIELNQGYVLSPVTKA
jgi:hypothetical protein